MEKYTNEEKRILLDAIDLKIDNLERSKNMFSADAKDEILQVKFKLKELRAKLILDIMPIIIHTEDMGNINIYDSWYFYCHLCGKTDGISFPETPIVDNHSICSECFKKYEPELYKKTMESNKPWRVIK